MNNGFVVVVDNSWYIGFIPFYIYFALRAYPDAQVFIYLRGKLDNEIRKQTEVLSPKGQWTIFENYKIDYPNNVFTTKALRWTILHDTNKMSKNIYIGDIDIMFSIEEFSLFEQHLIHCLAMGLPYSNIIRGKFQRLTGLHFIKVFEYMEHMREIIKKYDILLKNKCKHWGISNESLLFDMLKEANLLPIENTMIVGYDPKQINFRPHHGVHLGLFKCHKKSAMDFSIPYQKYLIDFLKTFEENSELVNILKKSNPKVSFLFNKAISYVKTKLMN